MFKYKMSDETNTLDLTETVEEFQEEQTEQEVEEEEEQSEEEEQAEQQGKLGLSHWAHMVIHGCLHLQGYDHVESEQAMVMENLEIKLLDSIGIGNPYIDDSDET